jgi:Cu/Ag efflux protein CusF
MRSLKIFALAIGPVLAISTAYAAMMAEGAIKSIDTKAGAVTLQNGAVYRTPKGFDLSKLKTGEKVKVEYDAQGKHFMATKITPVG